MKYNFLRAFTVLTFVFLVISLNAQDSLSAGNASVLSDSGAVKSDTAVKKISADTAVDSGAVKSDTILTSVKITDEDTSIDSGAVKLDTGLVKNELLDSILAMLAESAAEPETIAVIQEPPVELESAAALENVSPTAQETSEADEKLTVNYDEAVKMFFAENRALRWVRANMLYLIFFFVSVIIIIAAIFFFSTKKDGRRFLTTTRLSVLDKMVQKGCRYIESNYMDPALTVDAVCGELVTGAVYLNALFMKEIGIDVQSFIVQVRVNNIRNLLAENPDESDLSEICEQCGFKTLAEAQDHFAALCSVGIEEYRKSLLSHQKNPAF